MFIFCSQLLIQRREQILANDLEGSMTLNSYPELMALDLGDFVYAAYQLVLGRAPDEAGMNYYSARLRSGYSKLSVLHQLGTSGEQPNWDGLPGLRQALRRYRVGRLPLLGWVLRRFWRLEGNQVSERLQRAIASELADLKIALGALQSELRSAVSANDEAMRIVAAEIGAIHSGLQTASTGINEIAATQSDLRNAAAAVVGPRVAGGIPGGQPGPRANLVAERLSPRAKEIFQQIAFD